MMLRDKRQIFGERRLDRDLEYRNRCGCRDQVVWVDDDGSVAGEELGDLLFSLVNLARFLDVEAEEVLAQTVDRFTRRFHHIETNLQRANKSFDQSSLEEMDRLWEEAKTLEAQAKSST